MDEDRHSPRDVRLFSIRWNIGFIVIAAFGAIVFLAQDNWIVPIIATIAIAYSTYVLADDIIKLRKGIDSE